MSNSWRDKLKQGEAKKKEKGSLRERNRGLLKLFNINGTIPGAQGLRKSAA